jgi:Uma2 family endonuclease
MSDLILSPQPRVRGNIWRKRWTRDEYDKCIEIGVFTEEDKIELIDGELIKKMPVKPPHATALSLAEEALRSLLPTGFHTRNQQPIALSNRSEPEPDIAVVTGSVRDYARRHPETALLLIEISDSTLAFERSRKAQIYAKAGIQDYWIVNVKGNVVEVYRNPVTERGRGRYTSGQQFQAGETISPLAFPEISIAVSDILPD